MDDSPNDDSPKSEPPSRKGKGGKKGCSGPPKGSANAARHYLKGGKLPKHLAYVENRINAFRRHLEAAVIDAKGEVSLLDAAGISSACKWERHGVLAQHWLRKEAESLSASDRLRFSEAIAKASDQRDRNLRLLGLDAKAPAPWLLPAPKVTDIED